MKRWALLLAVVGIAGWTWTGCAGPPEAPGVSGPGDKAAGLYQGKDTEVYQKLQRPMREVKFIDLPFTAFLDWCRDAGGFNVHVKWATLATAGVEQKTTIKSVLLANVTVERVLKAVFDDVGGTNPLDYLIDDGAITISTREDLSGIRHRKTVIYDIRDLMPTQPPAEEGEYVNRLRRTITQSVDKESWMDPDGTGNVGSINYYGGLLIIQQTQYNHREIAALLADIRKHKPTVK